ncbi:hypothetical protein [Shewanella sp. FJAT-52076]|uniref:hypothetical protein n=1 Tax=Shewanella sp. FJAT-52076 TaxID=2864202 RepID=UPI001C660417|nr:hypothetical protein [Shewanella sp. FJAT-52076]QYJ74052.1 hypothetical protein K0H79_11755 [Shewanella sp. FJAT-52076]
MHQQLSKLWSFMRRLLSGKVAYLSADEYYSVDFDGICLNGLNSNETSKNQGVFALVLSRGSYTERVETVPITKRNELTKLAKSQVKRRGMDELFFIWPSHDGKTDISYFSLPVIPHFLKPKLILPESVIMPLSGAENANFALGTVLDSSQSKVASNPASFRDTVLEYNMLDGRETAYLAVSGRRKVSSVAVGLVNSVQMFALSQGISFKHYRTMSPSESQRALIAGLSRPSTYLFQPGLWRGQTEKQFRLSYEAVLPFVAGASLWFTLYLLGSDFLAGQLALHAKEENRRLVQAATQVMDTKVAVENDIERILFLSPLQQSSVAGLGVWAVLDHLYQQDGEVMRLERDGGDYRVQIKAASASGYLSYLLSYPGIRNARFDGTVRSERGKDVATILFEFNPDMAKGV